MNKDSQIEERINKILGKYFPDEMDSSMLHPNHSEAFKELSTLLNTEIEKEREKTIWCFLGEMDKPTKQTEEFLKKWHLKLRKKFQLPKKQDLDKKETE
jgi:hypothetical protein